MIGFDCLICAMLARLRVPGLGDGEELGTREDDQPDQPDDRLCVIVLRFTQSSQPHGVSPLAHSLARSLAYSLNESVSREDHQPDQQNDGLFVIVPTARFSC